MTDYQGDGDHSIKGWEEVSPGDTVTLRQFGHLSKAGRKLAVLREVSYVQHWRLTLICTWKDTDNSAYGLLYGPYSRLALDGSSVEYSDLEGMEVKFARASLH